MSNDDFERRLGQRVRAYLEEGVSVSDPARAAEHARRAPQSRWPGVWRGVLASGSVIVIAAVFVGAVLVRSQGLGIAGGEPTPAPSSPTSPGATPLETNASPEPSATLAPTPFIPVAWALRAITPPLGHPSIEVLGVSPDGSVVLFRDAASFDSLFVALNGAVSQVIDPGHETGTPVTGRLSPDGDFVVFDDASQLYRYDIASNQVTTLPAVGQGGLQWWVFASETTLAVVTATTDTPIHPTAVWTLDIPTGAVAQGSGRTDAGILFATSKGLVLEVDRSSAHDGSDLVLYLVPSRSGTDQEWAVLGAADLVAVSPDGATVGWSNATGAWLLAVDTGQRKKIAAAASVGSFAPDSSAIELTFADGHAEARGLDGAKLGSVDTAATAAWVGQP